MSGEQTPIVTETWPPWIIDRLARGDGLLLGLDFDGTLTPITDDPDEPTITAACRRAVKQFVTHPHATVAVISGRELSDLYNRISVPGVIYAGNHGLEFRYDECAEVHPSAAYHQTAVRGVLEQLPDRLAGVPGWEIEDKRLTATIHVRRTPPGRTGEVRSAIEAAIRDSGTDLRVASGKQVFEIRPAIDWDKGSAINWLSGFAPDGWQSVYLGDDTTDEDAFRAIRPDGIGVLVGSRESTGAAVRLPNQTMVAPFLNWLADEVLEEYQPTKG